MKTIFTRGSATGIIARIGPPSKPWEEDNKVTVQPFSPNTPMTSFVTPKQRLEWIPASLWGLCRYSLSGDSSRVERAENGSESRQKAADREY